MMAMSLSLQHQFHDYSAWILAVGYILVFNRKAKHGLSSTVFTFF